VRDPVNRKSRHQEATSMGAEKVDYLLMTYAAGKIGKDREGRPPREGDSQSRMEEGKIPPPPLEGGGRQIR